MDHFGEHPSDEVLKASIAEKLDAQAEGSIIRHLDHCIPCQRRLASMASGDEQSMQICQALKRESESGRSAASGSTGMQSVADFAVTFLDPTERPDAMGRLGEFDILSVIGHGGMGIVLKGFQEELNRPVAVKVMSPHLASVAVARKRFLREAQATAAIVHPNVMPILSVSESSSLPFLVMPFVACHSLQQRLDAEGPLPLKEVLRIAIQVAHGLAAAHAQGLVHRDVKPANILLERGIDRAMLTDFGLARAADDATVTRSGVIAGTPQYMSPEQARGEPIDARSDLFSLGSVVYAMAVGQPPFRGETSYGILRKITDNDPPSLRRENGDVPEWLDRLTLWLLSKDASDRPHSSADVALLLESCLAHVQQPASVPLPDELRSERPRMTVKRLLLGALILLLLALPGSVVVWYLALGTPSKPGFKKGVQFPVVIEQLESEKSLTIDEEIQFLHDRADQLLMELTK